MRILDSLTCYRLGLQVKELYIYKKRELDRKLETNCISSLTYHERLKKLLSDRNDMLYKLFGSFKDVFSFDE